MRQPPRRPLMALLLGALGAWAAAATTSDEYPNNYVGATLVRLNDNGAWSWFMDPRVIVHEGRLIAGSVRADYSGLAALDPNNADVVYLSTDADPVTGAPLVSAADRQRHYELFRGERAATGKWVWTPFTRHSTADNLRPVIPHWNDPRTGIVWMRGSYVHNQGEWYSAIVAAIVPGPPPPVPAQ